MNQAAKAKIGVIHTTPVTVQLMHDAFVRNAPTIEVMDILHAGLLTEVMRAGGLTPAISRTVCRHVVSAADLGCDAVLGACSSISEAFDVARTLVPVPVVKIDDAMAEEAIRAATEIAVIATVETTLKPTTQLIGRKAAEAGRSVEIATRLVRGAFQALSGGNPAEHDRLVLEEIRGAAETAGAIVLAQASMARLLPALGQDLRVPVFTSPDLAVRRVVAIINRDVLAPVPLTRPGGLA